MNVHFTRKTGFYGMGTPIEVLKDGDRWFMINHNSQKTMELTQSEAVLQVRFFFMKSQPFRLVNRGQDTELEITMNPILMTNYLIFFGLMLLIPIAQASLWAVLVLLLLYFVFLFSTLKKAYLIKEKTHGT